MKNTQAILRETRAALPALTNATEKKNAALEAIARRLAAEQDAILAANREDIEAAKSKYGEVMMDRLTLTEERIAGMAQGVLPLIGYNFARRCCAGSNGRTAW